MNESECVRAQCAPDRYRPKSCRSAKWIPPRCARRRPRASVRRKPNPLSTHLRPKMHKRMRTWTVRTADARVRGETSPCLPFPIRGGKINDNVGSRSCRCCRWRLSNPKDLRKFLRRPLNPMPTRISDPCRKELCRLRVPRCCLPPQKRAKTSALHKIPDSWANDSWEQCLTPGRFAGKRRS